MRFLSGQVRNMAGGIAIGSGAAAPAVSDSRLTYEFDRATIYLTSPDYINKRIIFKGTIGEQVVGSIYEVGLYSSTFGSTVAGNPSSSLASFERDVEEWSSNSFASGNHRLGFEALRLAPAASGTLGSSLPVILDLSNYANTDQITVAFHSLNANASSVRVRFRGVDNAAYYEFSVATPAAGYNVVSFNKSAATKVGIVDWSQIHSIEVSVSATATGAAQVDFDGIRIQSTYPDVDNVLISRSVLATPVTKTTYAEMDIEYTLEVIL